MSSTVPCPPHARLLSLTFLEPEKVVLEHDSALKVQLSSCPCVHGERNGERWKLQTTEVYSIGHSQPATFSQLAAQIFLTHKIDTRYPLPLCPLLWGH